MMAWRFRDSESTIHTDTFVRDDYRLSIRANLSNIQYTDAYQKKRLNALYERDYKKLDEELNFRR